MAVTALKLDSTICSPQDVQGLMDELRAYTRWFGHNAVKRQLKLRRHGSAEPELTPAARTLVHQLKPISAASLDDLLATLDAYRSEAPLVTITLAAPPAAGIKKSLVGWCRDNLAPNMLVNFQFNAAILGGLVVRTGSRVFDWSFRRQILDNRAKFPETLRNV